MQLMPQSQRITYINEIPHNIGKTFKAFVLSLVSSCPMIYERSKSTVLYMYIIMTSKNNTALLTLILNVVGEPWNAFSLLQQHVDTNP